MAKQKNIPQLEAEKAENERKLSQLQHQKQQLENRITYHEKGDRRKRAHHLITRGAAIESVAPLTKVLTEKAKGERGVPLTVNVPFGYLKDPVDKTKWIVDEVAAEVVKRIFKLCMEGRGPMQIAKLLQEEKVLNPTAYKRRAGIKTPSPETDDPYHCNTNTVVHILERREYTGCTVNFKTYTNSIWDKKQRETPLDKQAIFYNTHPAIIEQEVFDKVQEIRQQRHRRTKTGKSSLFSGMVYCADCGAKMRYCTTNYFEKRQDHFVCANYRSNTGSCSAHFIRAVVLEDLVWMHMKAVIFYVTRYEAHFRAVMEHKLLLSSEE